jgi:hypothetical protein
MEIQLAPTIVLLCWAGVSAPALVEQPLIVGVLEDLEPGNLSPGMAVAHVRIAFKKQGAEWVAFPTEFNTVEALADSESTILLQ